MRRKRKRLQAQEPWDILTSKRKGNKKGRKAEDILDEGYFFTVGPETGYGCVARFRNTKGSTTCARLCSEKVPCYTVSN